jgi:hypothetical protein
MFVLKVKRYIILAVVAVLLIAVFFASRGIRNFLQERNSLKSYNAMQADSLQFYKNELGEVVAEKQAAMVRIKDFREMDSRLKDIALEFDNVNRKLKNLASVTATRATVTQSIQTIIKDSLIVRQIENNVTDTVTVKSVNWSDEWTILQGYALADSVKVEIQMKVPLELITYYPNWRLFGKERKWLPRAKNKLRIEAKSKNPHVSITELEHVNLK